MPGRRVEGARAPGSPPSRAARARASRHLRGFLAEHPRQAPKAYVVCRCPEPLALDERITALPWWSL